MAHESSTTAKRPGLFRSVWSLISLESETRDLSLEELRSWANRLIEDHIRWRHSLSELNDPDIVDDT